MLLESEERYDLQLKVEDISDANEEGNETVHGNKKTDEEKIEKDCDVQKHEYIKSSENVCDLDEIKKQVAVMMSKEDIEAKSEKKITRLQLILKLLEEEEEEQSMGKEKPASGGMLIHKMSEIKPPDGTADDSEQISTNLLVAVSRLI